MRCLGAMCLLLAGCGRIGFGFDSATNSPFDAHSGDGDGDGAGDGDGGAISHDFFLGPTGDDSAAGTRTAPWRRFDFALPHLQPGDRLTLLDGDYDTSGALSVDCATTATNGTPSAPITVRADHPRAARLFGIPRPVDIVSCANWRIEDLFVDGIDDPANPDGPVVQLEYATGMVLHGLLVRHANRYSNNNCIEVAHSTDSIVEDTEGYECFRAAFGDFDSTGTTFRRIYANGRGVVDLSAGYPSNCVGGDKGFISYNSRAARIEDAITEDTCSAGFTVQTVATETGDTGLGDMIAFRGAIALGPGQNGFVVESACTAASPCTAPDGIARNNSIAEAVSIGFSRGFGLRGVANTLAHATAIGAKAKGVELRVDDLAGGVVASADVTSVLIIGGPIGVEATNQSAWSASWVGAFGVTTAFSPNDAHVTQTVVTDPMLGACMAYLPPGSPMLGAGPGGTNVGADIRTLVSTGAAAWQPTWTGCGAVIAGVNDDPATSCIGVHARLAIGAGCPLP